MNWGEEGIKVGDVVRFNGESEIIGIVTHMGETKVCTVMKRNGETRRYPECVLEGSDRQDGKKNDEGGKDT